MDRETVIDLGARAFAEQELEFILFSEDPAAFAVDIVHMHHNIQIYQAVFDIVFLHIEKTSIAKVDNIIKGIFHERNREC